MKTKRIKDAGGKSHLELSEGSCSVKIYSHRQTKKEASYLVHCVAYFEGGKRVRKSFSNKEQAKVHAQTALTRLINGSTSATDLTPVELQEAAMARAEVEPLDISLLTAAREYRKAVEQLGTKGTLGDAVRYFLSNASPDMPKKTVPEVCTEMLEANKTDGLSDAYLSDLKQRVEKFTKTFTGQISSITTAKIERWLRDLKTGAKNRDNSAGNGHDSAQVCQAFGLPPQRPRHCGR